MDHVKRQTGQHLEFEPEWEGAFNLQLKLEDNIVLFLEWCGSDVSKTGSLLTLCLLGNLWSAKDDNCFMFDFLSNFLKI